MTRVGVACLAAGLVACASAESKPDAGPAYTGPKARIAVADFEDKASGMAGLPFDLGAFAAFAGEGYGGGPGRGMSDMLVTALFETNRYILLERAKLQALLTEQDLGASGRVRRETAVAVGEIQGADLLITGAITGFDPGVSQSRGGIMSSIPIIGSLAGSRTKAYVAMDVRLIDARTSQIVAVTNVSGEASSYSGSASVVGGALGASLSGYRKTPMETAIRQTLQKAIEFIVAQTPKGYYRYTPTGEPIVAEAAPGASPAPKAAPVAAAAPAAGAPATGAALAGPSVPSNPLPAAALAPPPGPTARLHPPEAAKPPASARKALQSIRADVDSDLVADLRQVVRRGTVLTVVVSLTLEGTKAESQPVSIGEERSYVLDYATGEVYPIVRLDGFVDGRLKPGDVRVVRATFKAPPKATSAAITLSGIGTFDDVKLGE